VVEGRHQHSGPLGTAIADPRRAFAYGVVDIAIFAKISKEQCRKRKSSLPAKKFGQGVRSCEDMYSTQQPAKSQYKCTWVTKSLGAGCSVGINRPNGQNCRPLRVLGPEISRFVCRGCIQRCVVGKERKEPLEQLINFHSEHQLFVYLLKELCLVDDNSGPTAIGTVR
jgi:hypothetical protein